MALSLPRSLRARQSAPGLAIHPRSDWAGDGRPTAGPLPREEVRFLLVHHTAGPNNYGQAAVPGIIRGMYDFHTGPEKGWPDVAYNFLIDRFGGVWEARSGSIAGAVSGDATGGNQGFSQLVSLVGTFTGQLPTEAALESLRATLAWLADRHEIDTSPGATASFTSKGSNRHPLGVAVSTPTINGHRSMSQTSCPGEALFVYVSDGLMSDVTARRNAASAPTSTSTTTQATAATSVPTSTDPGPSTVRSLGTGPDIVGDVQALPGSRPDSIKPADEADPQGVGGATTAGVAAAGVAAAVAGSVTLRRRNS
ncbi:MAG: hypothetical protein ACI8TP_004758 [Acidimicrobiales bacterium]|jgi:hypothetical protein